MAWAPESWGKRGLGLGFLTQVSVSGRREPLTQVRHWGKRLWVGVFLAHPLKSIALTELPMALEQLLWTGISIKVDWGLECLGQD